MDREISRRCSIPKRISRYLMLSRVMLLCASKLPRLIRTGPLCGASLMSLRRDEAEKFQLVDTLKFQISELERAQLSIGEDERLDEERRRLANVEKLTTLCQSSYSRIYEDDDAALTRVRQSLKDVEELAEYESSFPRLSRRTGICACRARRSFVLAA